MPNFNNTYTVSAAQVYSTYTDFTVSLTNGTDAFSIQDLDSVVVSFPTGYYNYEVNKAYTNISISNNGDTAEVVFIPSDEADYDAGDETIIEIFSGEGASNLQYFYSAYQGENYGGAGSKRNIFEGGSTSVLELQKGQRAVIKLLFWQKDTDEFGFIPLGAEKVT